MGITLIVLGTMVSCIGGLWLLFVEFKESIFWGIGCLIFPILSLVFIILHWEAGKRPFAIYLLGAVILGIGLNIGTR